MLQALRRIGLPWHQQAGLSSESRRPNDQARRTHQSVLDALPRAGGDSIPLQFAQGAASAKELFERFEKLGYRGVITGPHDTGKTTLLRELEALACARGHEVVQITLRIDQRRMPKEWDSRLSLPAPPSFSGKRAGGLGAVLFPSPTTPLPPGERGDAKATGSARPTLLFLDGAEQLTRVGWWRVRSRCRRMGWGLLATTPPVSG